MEINVLETDMHGANVRVGDFNEGAQLRGLQA